MIPKVQDSETDGGLGVLPATFGKMQAIIGCASSGPVAAPAAYASISAVLAAYGNAGPLVELACREIELYGGPVVLCRAATVTVGTTSNLVTSGVLGTSVVTVDGTVNATDDGEIVVKITTGGTRGTPGITYQWSRDGGRTFSVDTALGSAVFILVPNSGVKFLIGAGTLLVGDTWSCVAVAPLWDATTLAAAVDAMYASKLNWEYATILGPATGANVDAVEAKRLSGATKGKHRWFQMHFRMPNVGETDATYQAAYSTAMDSHLSTGIDVPSAACKCLSSNPTLVAQYRRPSVFAYAGLFASVSEEQDIAQIKYGPLPGVQIRDANGNIDEHDELENPGLDDLMSTCLRTWDGRDGVFVNNPRLHAPVGSDFQFVQLRRVMNLARTALKQYLETRLSNDVVVDAKTGFILKSEADDIDSGANAALSAVLDGVPKASPSSPTKPRFAISRTDNLLSTNLIHYAMRIIPLGYIKALTGDSGFFNPAARVVT